MTSEEYNNIIHYFEDIATLTSENTSQITENTTSVSELRKEIIATQSVVKEMTRSLKITLSNANSHTSKQASVSKGGAVAKEASKIPAVCIDDKSNSFFKKVFRDNTVVDKAIKMSINLAIEYLIRVLLLPKLPITNSAVSPSLDKHIMLPYSNNANMLPVLTSDDATSIPSFAVNLIKMRYLLYPLIFNSGILISSAKAKKYPKEEGYKQIKKVEIGENLEEQALDDKKVSLTKRFYRFSAIYYNRKDIILTSILGVGIIGIITSMKKK